MTTKEVVKVANGVEEVIEVTLDSNEEEDILTVFTTKEDIISCVKCNETHSVLCCECGNKATECDCAMTLSETVLFCMACDIEYTIENATEEEVSAVEDEALTCSCTPQQMYFCAKCGVTRGHVGAPYHKIGESSKGSWENGSWDDYDYGYGYGGDVGKKHKSSKPTSSNGWKNSGTTTTPYVNPDRHYHEAVDLGGVTIYCSSMNNGRNMVNETQPYPDFGLYADYGWHPTWRNEMINWPDYGIPPELEIAAQQIHDAYVRAVGGEVVEIGCIGGHGRTGTILACMKLYHDFTSGETRNGEECCAWVQMNYCKKAVETDEQEWFVDFFAHHFFGTELPEKPEAWKSSYSSGGTSTGCSQAEHLAMSLRGWTQCAAKGDKCTFWKTDEHLFNNPKVNKSIREAADKKLELYDLRFGGLEIPKDKDAAHEFENHYVMYSKGWTQCALIGDDCKFWEEDYKKFLAGEIGTLDHTIIQDYINDYPACEKKEEADG